jgi:hypothetical protein
MARKGAEAQRFSPLWWINPPKRKTKICVVFSSSICVKKKSAAADNPP